MKKEFPYKPPIKYLLIGLTSTPTSFLFFPAIGRGELWFSIVCVIFGLAMFAMGIAFLAIFINKFGVGKLVITNNCIVIPGWWKERKTVNFDEITELSEFNTYDEVIELVTTNEVHLIEKKWMDSKNFETVRNHLAELHG